ncbi:response regulator [Streptomyces sp. NPDC057717]|uniref:response regulator n=1 Tax=Streptomyces sp. NPDC057717 TaxID=3346224 RepID=UPI00368C62DE
MAGTNPDQRPTQELIRTLVVEDDPAAAEAHAMYVRRVPGFEVAGIARTGAEARRLLLRTQVDLLLLDLHLTDGHGLTLARTLRATGHRADVIAVTSVSDLAVVREGVSLGVVQYVLKPFTFTTLRDRLVCYAEFRATSGEADGQDEVDQVLAALRAPRPAEHPKGVSTPTLKRVRQSLRAAAGEGLSAEAVASAAGVSRITARRYLEHLVSLGRAARSPRYGQVGRPELNYRWANDAQASSPRRTACPAHEAPDPRPGF